MKTILELLYIIAITFIVSLAIGTIGQSHYLTGRNVFLPILVFYIIIHLQNKVKVSKNSTDKIV